MLVYEKVECVCNMCVVPVKRFYWSEILLPGYNDFNPMLSRSLYHTHTAKSPPTVKTHDTGCLKLYLDEVRLYYVSLDDDGIAYVMKVEGDYRRIGKLLNPSDCAMKQIHSV